MVHIDDKGAIGRDRIAHHRGLDLAGRHPLAFGDPADRAPGQQQQRRRRDQVQSPPPGLASAGPNVGVSQTRGNGLRRLRRELLTQQFAARAMR